MWSALAIGGLLTALHPLRLAIIALLISRPRPIANLLAFWVGAVAFGIPSLLIPLLLLHSTPGIESFTQGLSRNAVFHYVQIGIGALAILAAAVMLVRSLSRPRVVASSTAGTSSTLVLDPEKPTGFSQLLGRGDDGTAGSTSPFGRLLRRANASWENGSLWVAVLIGVLMGGPSIDGVVMGLVLIVTSGATVGAQLIVAVIFVFEILLVVEVILISSLVAPSKTRTMLGYVHNWVQTQRRKILIVLFTVVGLVLIAQGLGVL